MLNQDSNSSPDGLDFLCGVDLITPLWGGAESSAHPAMTVNSSRTRVPGGYRERWEEGTVTRVETPQTGVPGPGEQHKRPDASGGTSRGVGGSGQRGLGSRRRGWHPTFCNMSLVLKPHTPWLHTLLLSGPILRSEHHWALKRIRTGGEKEEDSSFPGPLILYARGYLGDSSLILPALWNWFFFSPSEAKTVNSRVK